MDTSIFCVYNLERRVFLSSKMTIVDGLNEPLKVVRLLVSGLGVEAESGLWLTHLHGILTIPKPFPYDLACLDKDLRVVETIEVLPGVDFPPHRGDISSAIVLPSETLRSSQTRVGDRLFVCPTDQADQLLVELATQVPLTKHPVMHSAEIPPHSDQEPLGSAQASPVSITEVIVEKPDISDRPGSAGVGPWSGLEDLFSNWIDSPAAPPSWIIQKARERETGTNPLETSAAEKPAVPKNQDPQSADPASVSLPDQIRSEMAQTLEAVSPMDRKKEPQRKPSSTTNPAPASIPQKTQNTTFTSAQYGMWQVSIPTASGPIASAKRPPSNGELSRQSEISTRKTAGADIPTAKAEQGQASARATEKSFARPDVKQPERSAIPPVPANGVHPAKMPSATPELHPQAVTSPQTNPAKNDLTHKDEVADPSSKPAPSDFDMVVQNKLDRIQAKAQVVAAGVPLAKPQPVFAKNGPRENPKPPVKAQSPGSTKPLRSSVNTNGKNGAPGKESGVSVAPSVKRFAKPNPAERQKPTNTPERSNGNPKNGKSDGLGARFKRWLYPPSAKIGDRRRGYRRYVPGMVAHYFTGGAPKPHDVADISMSGMYLHTDDHWLPDTMIRMTLQKPCAKGGRKQSITVLSKIVRRGSDGVAAEFVMEESLDPNSRDILPSHATDRFTLARFI